MRKRSRDVELEQRCESGAGTRDWRRDAKPEQGCRTGAETRKGNGNATQEQRYEVGAGIGVGMKMTELYKKGVRYNVRRIKKSSM